MSIFIEVVVPVILVFLIGFGVQKWKKVDIKPISTMAIFIMTPCLVFRTFYTSDINLQYAYMIIFSLILFFAIILVNKGFSKLRNYPPSVEGGLILSTAFMNSGNYGVPIILFAYGEIGFHYAVSLMVIQSILMNFFGVYYAVRGKDGMATAVKAVLMMPATWAVILAILLKAGDWDVPQNLFMTVDMIANATIPTVMIILGMQLALIERDNFEWGKVSFAVVVRLFTSPVLAWIITLFIPFDPTLAKVLIVLAAMPSAATIVMYAVQFNSEPRLVSSITLITTLISIVTITVLLTLLG